MKFFTEGSGMVPRRYTEGVAQHMVSTFFAFILVLTLYCSPILAASITVSPSGSGAFAILGEGMNGVAGIDITLRYDSPALASPSVTQGGLIAGALFTANTTVPGSIRIAVIRSSPFSGSGQIAAVSFASNGGSGGITAISAQLIDAKGANLPVQAAIVAGVSSPQSPLTNPSTLSTSAQTTAATTTGSPAAGTSIPGTVALPVDPLPKSEPKQSEPPARIPMLENVPASDDDSPRQQERIVEKAVTPEKVVELKRTSYGSVLDRFKVYEGLRTPAVMMALFGKSMASELRQEPAIAISDGSMNVRIYAAPSKESGSAPNFSVSGAEVVSLTYEDGTGALVLNVLPKKGVMRASVTMITDQAVTTFPLTIVPPSAVAVSTSEAVFADFLKDAGTEKPRFDLNSDGIHDYLDDYIYTGLYLIKKAATGNKTHK